MPGEADLATGQSVTGTIRYVAPVADQNTRTFEVELAIDNPDGDLPAGATAVRPDLIASLLRSVQPGASVRWQAGTCAVLEEVAGEAVQRRLAFRQIDAGWEVAREEVVEQGETRLAALFDDYRVVEGNGAWPHRSEIQDPDRGSTILLETKKLRTDGVSDGFFRMQD